VRDNACKNNELKFKKWFIIIKKENNFMNLSFFIALNIKKYLKKIKNKKFKDFLCRPSLLDC
jgi:hypothetical protein